MPAQQRSSHFLSKVCLFAVPLSLMLSGCGSGSSSSGGQEKTPTTNSGSGPQITTNDPEGNAEVDPSDLIRYFGVVNFDHQNSQLEVGGAFVEFGKPLSLNAIAATDTLMLDSCEILYGTSGEISRQNFDEHNPFGFGSTTFVSAGDSLLVTSPEGTLATVSSNGPFGESFFFGYGDDQDLVPAPVPKSLVLNVPGNTFPAFSAVPVPDVNYPRLTGPEFRPGTLDKPLRWRAGDPEESTISFNLSNDAYDTAGAEVYCRVRDDGEFTLPKNVQSALRGNTEHFSFDHFSRLHLTRIQKGDAILSIYTNSE